MKDKKKLSFKKALAIFTPIMAAMLALCIAIPVVAVSSFDLVLRDFFGEKEVERQGSVDGLDVKYSKSDYKTKEELDAAEKEFVRSAAGEGYVLLMNDTSGGKGLPLKTSATAKTKVSLFSHSSVDIIAGGTGSGTGTSSVDLKQAFEAQNYEVNSTLWNFYSTGAGKGYVRGAGAINYGGSENWAINEAPLSVLNSNGVLDSANNTTAFFVLSRTGGEGRDLGRYMGKYTSVEEDKAKHYLEPDSVELGVIQYLNEKFDNVILLVNTNNIPELGWVKNYANIKSVLWCPGGGGETANSIVDVISGKVNPSGRLVDTIAYDAFSSPAMANMGDFRYTVNGQPVNYYGISYDEGIYVGYKYYETRYYDYVYGAGKASSQKGSSASSGWKYETEVQYPFGYGLSYTSFEWSAFNMSDVDANGQITVSVTVKNTGNVAGKEVVQVYVKAPYTAYDKEKGIEKSAVSLVGYAKTSLLAPSASETVSVKIKVSDFTSYDDVGAKTYILEAGDYVVTAAKNAHEAVNNVLSKEGKKVSDGMTGDGEATFAKAYNVAATDKTTYAKSLAGATVANRFDDANYIARNKYLTRNDWEGSFPVPHGSQEAKVESTNGEKNGYQYLEAISADLYAKLQEKGTQKAANSPLSDEEAAKKMLEYGKNNPDDKNEAELIDYRGLEYKDADWNKLLIQISKNELDTLINLAGYRTAAIKSVNKPASVDLDGPAGLNNMVNHALYTITYPAEVTIAATFNKDISEQWGRFVGNDGLRDNVKANAWYAPACNIHRTPFAGRNFEYFSEDSFLSGDMTAAAVSGAASKGMFAYVKHFALNDQEDHRTDNGLATFSNEQAIREIYLKPFQMAVETSTPAEVKYYSLNSETGEYEQKTAFVPACQAIMSSFNRIGYTWAGGDYRLITEVLRNEWGFNGIVLTDYSQGGTSYMHNGQMLRAGADLALTQYTWGGKFTVTSKADIYYAQQAAKHTLYTVANSNAMNGLIHGVSVTEAGFAYYTLVLIAIDVVLGGVFVFAGVEILMAYLREKKKAAL